MLACAALGALPDADLLFGVHRTASHSIGAMCLVTIFAAVVTGWVTSWRGPVVRVALTCGAAYGTHLLLDWLAIDRYPPSGIQLLWPFSHRWFISGLDLFPQVQRYRFFSADAIWTNAVAVAWESLVLLPVLAALWRVRVKALSRFSTELSRGDHAA